MLCLLKLLKLRKPFLFPDIEEAYNEHERLFNTTNLELRQVVLKGLHTLQAELVFKSVPRIFNPEQMSPGQLYHTVLNIFDMKVICPYQRTTAINKLYQ